MQGKWSVTVEYAPHYCRGPAPVSTTYVRAERHQVSRLPVVKRTLHRSPRARRNLAVRSRRARPYSIHCCCGHWGYKHVRDAEVGRGMPQGGWQGTPDGESKRRSTRRLLPRRAAVTFVFTATLTVAVRALAMWRKYTWRWKKRVHAGQHGVSQVRKAPAQCPVYVLEVAAELAVMASRVSGCPYLRPRW